MEPREVVLPSTVSLNVFKAYINENISNKTLNRNLNAINLKWDSQQPRRLRTIVLDSIIQNWHENPILTEIPRLADRNYLLENIDTNLPVKILSAHIRDDVFWKRCFYNRWTNYCPHVDHNKKWISVYMEKDLSEMLENLEPCHYDQEEIQPILEQAASYIEELEINCLQPSMGELNDHIPFDFILSNLYELKKFRISYGTKNIGTSFYLGCSNLSRNDALYLCRGLQKTYDLLKFYLYSSKLDVSMIKTFAKSLDKGCPNLSTLALTNCRIGDAGFIQFIKTLSVESFVNLRTVILANNFFSQETALWLSKVIRGRQIEHLDLRMNPIGADGAGTLLSMISELPIKTLNLSACSITESIGRMLLKLLIENKTLLDFDISNNDLGNVLGSNIYKIIGFNKTLKRLDLRNTNISSSIRRDINAVLFQNRDKL